MHRPTGKTKPANIRAEERRHRVIQLRIAGMTYRRICQVMWDDRAWRGLLPPSYNARHCHEDVCIVLKRQRAAFDETVTVIRQQEIDRLDRMLVGIWSRAQNGDCQAIASVLKLMERRARLIPQLEAPIAVAPVHAGRPEPPAAPEDIQAVAAQLAAFGLAQQHNGNGLVTEP